jgi:hypothetical protein
MFCFGFGSGGKFVLLVGGKWVVQLVLVTVW